MFSTLLGRWWVVLLLLGVLAGVQPARATHLLGGEMTYRYLDNKGPAAAPLRYEITVTIYNNCGNSGIVPPRTDAAVGIYDQATGAQVVLTSVNYPYTYTLAKQSGMMSIPSTSVSGCISAPIPPGCNITGVTQPYILQRFVGQVNLPNTSKGYYAVFTDGARNTDVTNLDNSNNQQSLSLYVALDPPQLPNHAPEFSDVAVAIICANDTTYLLNNAVDADGDRLVYSFGQPYAVEGDAGVLPTTFQPPLPAADYVAGFGYAPTTPFGTASGNYASINPNTGVAKYLASRVGGKYVVAIDVKEYRTINGQEVLLGTTRRDLQLAVAQCPPTAPPVLPPPTVTPRNYTVEVGATLSVPITATQPGGDPLELTFNSELLDGAGGHNATINNDPGTVATLGRPTGIVVAKGTGGTVTGTLTFTPGCTEARATPYDVALTLKDVGCAGKTVVDVLHITVTKPTGPTAIGGDKNVCDLNAPHSYSATGGTAPRVSWRVVGGTFVNGNTGNPVAVKWTTAGTGLLVARGLSLNGCLTDSVQQQVTVAPPSALTITGNQTICQGSSTSLAATGSSTYTLTGGGVSLSGAGPFTVSPTQTTTYTLTGAPVAGGCSATTQVTVQVTPALPTSVQLATPAPQCAGSTFTLTPVPTNGGSAPTYAWFVNGRQVATGATFSSNTLGQGDSVRVVMTPTVGFCASGPAKASVSISLTPVVLPTVAIATLTTLPVCAGTSVDFRVTGVTAAGPNPQYQWQIDGVDVAGAQGTTFSTDKLRDGQQVRVLLRTSTVCGPVAVPSTAELAAILPTADVEAGPDKVITEGDEVVLEGTANGKFPVKWLPTLGLRFAADSLRPVASPPTTTTYTLSGTIGPCPDQSSVTVTVTRRIHIPNAFSPNGDGNDDTWQIDNIEDYPDSHVTVVNRWGSKVFETKGYSRNNEWSGQIGGQPAPVGTYYYIITLGNGKSYSGPLTVLY